MPATQIWMKQVLDRMINDLGYEETAQIISAFGDFNPESNEITLTTRRMKEVFASYLDPQLGIYKGIWSDDFSSNRLTSYMFKSGAPSLLQVTGGVMTVIDDSTNVVLTPASPGRIEELDWQDTTASVKIKLVPGIGYVGLFMRGSDPLDLIEIGVERPTKLVLYTLPEWTQLAHVDDPGITLDNTWYWLVARIIGNSLMGELWDTDPSLGGTPKIVLGYTMTAEQAARFSGPGPVGLDLWAENGDSYDDLRIESLR